MKTVDFSYTGGLPLEQPVLDRMQSATLEALSALIKNLGCADAGNFIIYGCEVVGANITPGFMYIDGELCPFAGAVGTSSTKIKKTVIITNAAFENGTNPPVFKETIAQVHASGTELNLFVKFYPVHDQNYVHTDNNFTLALLTKLNGIATGAEVNVQASWLQTNPALDNFIVGKPSIENILWSGSTILGDFPSGQTGATEIVFPTVGTTNYRVRAYIKSLSAEGFRAVDCISWTTADYKHDRFDFIAGEIFGATPGGSFAQNIQLFFDIIQN